MEFYGCSMSEVCEWTIPQALEFNKVVAKRKNQDRLVNISDMATAFAATQSKEGNKAFQKFISELQREL